MPDKSKLQDSGYPVFSGYRIVGYTDEYHFEEPQLIVVARGVGGTGDVKLSPPKAYITNLSISVVVDPAVADKDFLYYYFQQNNLRYLDSGSAQSQITIADLQRLEVQLPDLAVQRRIAVALRLLDDKIELNRKMNETLEQMARAIFKSWFIDFDPVHAKRQGKKPFGMDDATSALFPDSFEQSELGEIPRGWRVTTVGDVYEFAYGKALKAEDRKPGPNIVMGSNGAVGFHDAYLVKGPGVVIGRKGNPGIIKYVTSNFFPIDTAFYLTTKVGELKETHYFSSLLLESLNLASLGADSAVPGLNRNLAYMSKICLPQGKAIISYEQTVESLLQLKECNENEIETLTSTRDLLLPRLLSGEIGIKEATT